jgi:hypothetical protein
MANQAIFTPMRALDENGDPVPGALATFHVSGTATLADIEDGDGVALENPLEADGDGFFVPVFAAVALKATVTDADGAALPGYPIDPVPIIQTFGASAGAITFAAQENLPETDVQAALEFLADTVEAMDDDLGTFAVEDVADRVQDVDEWTTGTNTTAKMVSAAHLRAVVDARVPTLRPVWQSAEQTITSGGTLTLAHTLGVVPRLINARLRCTLADADYDVDDVISISLVNNSTSGTSRVNGIRMTTTEIVIRFSDATNVFVAGNADTGTIETLTNSSWKLVITAQG